MWACLRLYHQPEETRVGDEERTIATDPARASTFYQQRAHRNFTTTSLMLLAAWLFRSRETFDTRIEQRLVLRLATTGAVDRQVQTLLKQRLPGHRLVGLATARGGAALDMTVCLAPLAMEEALALVAELNRIEGVQGVELKE